MSTNSTLLNYIACLKKYIDSLPADIIYTAGDGIDISDDYIISSTISSTDTTTNDFTVINVLNTPPSSPDIGDQYRAGAANGGWTLNDIETWNGGSWDAEAPDVNDYLYQTTDDKTFQFKSDNTWKPSPGIAILNNGNKISNGVKIGTNNNRNLSFKTNKIIRAVLDTDGTLTFARVDNFGNSLQSHINPSGFGIIQNPNSVDISVSQISLSDSNVQTYTTPLGFYTQNSGYVGTSYLSSYLTSDGLTLPQYSNATERDAHLSFGGNLRDSQIIYRSDLQAFEWYNHQDTSWHSLGSGGGSSVRFGIEDNTGVQNRIVEMGDFSLLINSTSDTPDQLTTLYLSPTDGYIINTLNSDTSTEIFANSLGAGIRVNSHLGSGSLSLDISDISILPRLFLENFTTGAGYVLTDLDGDGYLTMQPSGGGGTPSLQQVHDIGNSISRTSGSFWYTNNIDGNVQNFIKTTSADHNSVLINTTLTASGITLNDNPNGKVNAINASGLTISGANNQNIVNISKDYIQIHNDINNSVLTPDGLRINEGNNYANLLYNGLTIYDDTSTKAITVDYLGVKFPVYTTAERDLLSANPSLMLYNTDLSAIQYYNGAWITLGGSGTLQNALSNSILADGDVEASSNTNLSIQASDGTTTSTLNMSVDDSSVSLNCVSASSDPDLGTSGISFYNSTLNVTGNFTVGSESFSAEVQNLSTSENAGVSGNIISGDPSRGLSLISTTGKYLISQIINAANDSAAASLGVPIKGLYHNAGVVRVRLT